MGEASDGGSGAVGIGVKEAAGEVKAGAGAAGEMLEVRDETARGVIIVVEGGKGGGEAGEEGGAGGWWAEQAGPRQGEQRDEATAGVSDEADALRGSADVEDDEILIGAGGSIGDDGDGGGGGGRGEVEGVERESLGCEGEGVILWGVRDEAAGRIVAVEGGEGGGEVEEEGGARGWWVEQLRPQQGE